MTNNEARAKMLAEVANYLIAAFPDEILKPGKRLNRSQTALLNAAIMRIKYLEQ